MKDPRTIVRRALITEKGTVQRERANQFTFEVAPDANKIEIRRAVQQIFNVKVVDVHTMRRMGKTKRMGRYVGQRPEWKRAIVTLAAGQSISLFDEI